MAVCSSPRNIKEDCSIREAEGRRQAAEGRRQEAGGRKQAAEFRIQKAQEGDTDVVARDRKRETRNVENDNIG
jgi:hypothetical protein